MFKILLISLFTFSNNKIINYNNQKDKNYWKIYNCDQNYWFNKFITWYNHDYNNNIRKNIKILINDWPRNLSPFDDINSKNLHREELTINQLFSKYSNKDYSFLGYNWFTIFQYDMYGNKLKNYAEPKLIFNGIRLYFQFNNKYWDYNIKNNFKSSEFYEIGKCK